jgi:hypothetical protein
MKAAQAACMTFSECVLGYINSHGDGWRNAKHRQQWQNTLDTYAAPVIGEVDVAGVGTAHVLKILEPIWKAKTETASRVRGRIESVLSWATVAVIAAAKIRPAGRRSFRTSAEKMFFVTRLKVQVLTGRKKENGAKKESGTEAPILGEESPWKGATV